MYEWEMYVLDLRMRLVLVGFDLMKQPCKEYSQMLLALEFYDPRPEVAKWIMRAYNDPGWNWEDCDGCTAVSEARFPKGYKYPPCVMHDYFCDNWKRLGLSRAFGDKMFFLAMLDFKMTLRRAMLRWAAVRAYWLLIGIWKDGK